MLDSNSHLSKYTNTMLTQEDLLQLQEKGISAQQIESQLNYFKTGFPFLQIIDAASIGNGIMSLSEDEENKYLDAWQQYLKDDKTVTKFVPASGAASRMFKDLFEFVDAEYDTPQTEFEKTFFDNITKFAFHDALNETCKKMFNKSIVELVDEKKYKTIIKGLLSEEGLNYANLPKGLLLFHKYKEGNRTPLGEHMAEGSLYAKDKDGVVNLHFTVSKEHKSLFELLVAARRLSYEIKLKTIFDVTYSVQKKSTDTIAADLNNNPFRNTDGSLMFRPGGHGALIENLNEIDSDIIFIKNIDNVIPDRLKEEESKYKQLLAGILVSIQRRAHDYLIDMTSGNVTSDKLQEILQFTEKELTISTQNKTFATDEELKEYLIRKLDRPFRVCGMVKNQGEPGGGPFIAINQDGTSSLQILESSQINKDDAKSVDAFKNGSHFNPVDLVCGVKCYKHEKFDLTNYIDKNTGFISQKSAGGKALQALELPGLWNGAMSDWNTIFVEVPISTFNPVKTVNDLLRPEHQ